MSKAQWLALSALPGVGGVTLKRLVERFGSVAGVFDAADDQLQQVPRVTADVVARLRATSLDQLEEELVSLSEEGVQVLTWDDSDYPANLRPIGDAPPVLFVRGVLRPADQTAVAIVGTRQPTAQGAQYAEGLALELAARGVTIVSGLALGIDTFAHQGALLATDGRTLAVLGCGLRLVHPAENRALAEQIERRGAVLSEFRPDTPPRGPQLMARDRVVSGLSRAVIVVEAGEQSGSLDTADKARRQGRLVLAVPGSPGADQLLQQGVDALDPAAADLDALVRRLSAASDALAPPPPPAQLSLW